MNLYKPLFKSGQITLGNGHVVIVCGWLPKERLIRKLDAEQYAAIGQLYSPSRGIDILIRNLLANPAVTILAIASTTREDSNLGGCQALFDFFSNGVQPATLNGKELWQIVTTVPNSFIGGDIPLTALESLRTGMTVTISHTLDDFVKSLDKLNGIDTYYIGTPDREYLLISPPVADVIALPGKVFGNVVTGKTVADTWLKMVKLIRSDGVVRPTGYDGQWQELINLTAVVTDEPKEWFFPEPNYLPADRAFMEGYQSQMCDDAPVMMDVKYTYGQRMRSHFHYDQVQLVINKLLFEPDSASAVINLWDVDDHFKGGSPCLNHVWLRIVDAQLVMTALFRSNDIYSAWPCNAMGLRSLQYQILDSLESLNITIGPLITTSLSAHIYDDCFEAVDNIPAQRQSPTYSDPAGNFIIEVSDGSIQVVLERFGQPVTCFDGRVAKDIYLQIANAVPNLQTSHALYLGYEFSRAERAIALGVSYKQDC